MYDIDENKNFGCLVSFFAIYLFTNQKIISLPCFWNGLKMWAAVSTETNPRGFIFQEIGFFDIALTENLRFLYV